MTITQQYNIITTFLVLTVFQFSVNYTYKGEEHCDIH